MTKRARDIRIDWILRARLGEKVSVSTILMKNAKKEIIVRL